MKIIVRRQPSVAMRLLGMILIIGTTGVVSCQALFNDRPAFYTAPVPAADVPVHGGHPTPPGVPR